MLRRQAVRDSFGRSSVVGSIRLSAPNILCRGVHPAFSAGWYDGNIDSLV